MAEGEDEGAGMAEGKAMTAAGCRVCRWSEVILPQDLAYCAGPPAVAVAGAQRGPIPARDAAGVWKERSGPEGRARADASENGGMGVHARRMHGVAQSARRPDYRRMVSTSDRQGVPLVGCPDTGG